MGHLKSHGLNHKHSYSRSGDNERIQREKEKDSGNEWGLRD